MLSFARNSNSRSMRASSHLAMAIALLTGTAVGVTALETPAYAQKKKKKKEDEAPKADYSKGFIAAYTPVSEMAKAEAPDEAAIRAAVPGVVAAIETDDDRNAGGGLVYSIGTTFDDQQLQLQGLDLMIAAGKADQTKLGQYYFTQYQLYRDMENVEKARTALEGAIGLNYTFEGRVADGTTKTFNTDDLRVMVSELYFDRDDFPGGLNYLKGIINERVEAGQPVSESWIRRGFAMAFNNGLGPQAAEFGEIYLTQYPSPDRWGDVIAVQRNYFDYGDQELLDLLRLAVRTNSLRTDRDYNDYINVADARRLPGEVGRVIDAGIAAGLIGTSDSFIAEAKAMASSQVSGLRSDLSILERDARSGSASLASGAGDAYLNFEQFAKAEEMYSLAVGKSGGATDQVLTRLGIAQLGQGKIAEAKVTFAKVSGIREPIASLWSLYADSLATPMPAQATEPAPTSE